MVGILMSATDVVFVQFSFMIELFWMPGIHTTHGVREEGVYVFMTTNVSTRSHSCKDWLVFFLPGSKASWIVGNTYGHELGTVRDVYPRAADSDMAVFLADQYPDFVPFHAWIGYSKNSPTLDNMYHALDYYWQSPGEYLSGVYHHFLLLDVSDPKEWYASVMYKFLGPYRMADPPRPNIFRRAAL
jgi:hypothetical protein